MAERPRPARVQACGLTAADVAELGISLAAGLGPKDTVLLYGPIGAGKTHLARAIIQAKCGANEEVPSPTYTLVQEYLGEGGPIAHADLYRMSCPDELAELGIRDGFGHRLTLVEWPELLGEELPVERLEVRLALDQTGDLRDVTISSPSPRLISVARASIARLGLQRG